MQAAAGIFHLGVMCLHLIFFYDNKIIVWFLLFLTLIQSFRVALSIIVSDSLSSFFEELWNWLDLFGAFFLIIHCVGSLFDEGLVFYKYYG